MNRRSFIRDTAIAGTAAAATGLPLAASAAEPKAPSAAPGVQLKAPLAAPADPKDVTGTLARYIVAARFEDLP